MMHDILFKYINIYIYMYIYIYIYIYIYYRYLYIVILYYVFLIICNGKTYDMINIDCIRGYLTYTYNNEI